MTDAARAAVEAIAQEWLDEHVMRGRHHELRVASLADCLLAFAAAQRKEEREWCIDMIVKLGDHWHNALPDDRPALMVGINQIVRDIRARREGPGGARPA